MAVVYVIVHDGGCEGNSAPIQAFSDPREAFAVARLMGSTETFRVYETPVWPNAQQKQWFNIEPVKES